VFLLNELPQLLLTECRPLPPVHEVLRRLLHAHDVFAQQVEAGAVDHRHARMDISAHSGPDTFTAGDAIRQFPCFFITSPLAVAARTFALTSIVSRLPPLSTTSVMGTTSPSFICCFRSIIITW
jgi:hypothetical protein